MVTLRDYQQDIYDKVRQSMARGNKRVLAVLPCGAGKSYIFAKMAENTNGSVLVLTHRKELFEQTGKLLPPNAEIAMILTEAKHLGERPKPKLIITDEAHLSRANSWMKVLEFYNTYTVGFTATPVRLDGKPLGDMYEDLVQGVSVKWLIENDRLSPFKYYAPAVVDTDDLVSHGGDFVIKDLDELMADRAIYGDVWKSWERLAFKKKTIAYCVSVERAKQTAKMFCEHGIQAVELDSTTPDKRRKQVMDDFRNGKYTVLCNVGIISEGVSIDDVECCLLLRPTESHALFWQQAMRCMRFLPGKTATIIDCVGNYSRNPMPDADIVWSLTEAPKKPKRLSTDGSFTIRSCPECFRVFPGTMKECPFCGAVYPLKPREIKAHKDIELREITAQEALQAEQKRKELRREQGRAKSLQELLRIARERGYKPQWAYMVYRSRK